MLDISIRLAQPADRDWLESCACEAYSRYIPRIGKPPAPMLADFMAHITAQEAHIAQAQGNGRLGYIILRHQAAHLELDSIAVIASRMGYGLGKRLMMFAEDRARAQGLNAIHLYTNAKMYENILIYQKLGYTEVDRRHADGFDRVFFEKHLGPA